MRELVISERAEADLREIWHYSFDTWGEVQADRYLDELDAGMRKCGAEPEGGKQQEARSRAIWLLVEPGSQARRLLHLR